MNEELLIIFGAGASHDCADQKKSSVREEYKPPLTNQIFSRQYSPASSLVQSIRVNGFKDSILNKHFLASSIGHEFDDSGSLENYLAKLKSSIHESDMRKYFALCVYLQELFTEISKNYLNAPLDNNFHSLLHKLVRTDYTRFNFITTNYDTIFDVTLEKLFNIRFNSLSSYLNFSGDGKVFNYIKAHGSVNWCFLLNQHYDQLGNWTQIRNGEITPNSNLMRSVENADTVNVGFQNLAGVTKFPAMAVPLGTYKFVNQNQIESFKNQSLNLKHLLIIGYSGKDNTIFDLLKVIIKNRINIFIVDRDLESVNNLTKALKSNLNSAERQITGTINHSLRGFTGFINNDCDNWIKSIINTSN